MDRQLRLASNNACSSALRSNGCGATPFLRSTRGNRGRDIFNGGRQFRSRSQPVTMRPTRSAKTCNSSTQRSQLDTTTFSHIGIGMSTMRHSPGS